MKILIACEFTGTVRDAFRARGHDAWSCDLTGTEVPGPHIIGDVREILNDGWDLMIAHPPCTFLAASGARWNHTPERRAAQAEALDFVRLLLNAPIPRKALENPVGRISSVIRKPDQTIQPWMFGVNEWKATCLWLENLPRLVPTKILLGISKTSTHRMPPSPTRGRDRSRTWPQIAEAMAAQWG